MSVGVLALIISFVSMLIAGISLGWNVYRDVLLKPRVKTDCRVTHIYHGESEPLGPFVSISAVNHGPGEVTVTSISLKQTAWWRRLFRREHYAFLVHDYTNPYSGRLPATLEVGKGVDLLVDCDEDCFLKEPFSHVGLADSFGRTHWSPRRQIRRARREWQQRFPR